MTTATPHALWPSLLPPADQGRDDLCIESARGVRIRFSDGRERLCATSGLWNVPLGYGNPVVADAIARAAHDSSYGAVFRYENVHARRAAEQLVALCGPDHFQRVLFSTSGGAANDLVMKLARHYHALQGRDRRKLVVALKGSYHGLTFGGFSLTGEELGQQAYGVDRRLVRHVDPADPGQLQTLLDRSGDQVAAVVVEPVLGSGAVPIGPELIDVLCAGRVRHGFVLVADEVATGFARTGPMFASEQWPVRPDVLIMSKALTNGTCGAAAVAVAPHVASAFHAGDALLVHAETQAGTAVTSAAISATLTELERIDAVTASTELGAALERVIDSVIDSDEHAVARTGRGAFQSLRLIDDTGESLAQDRVPEVVAAVREEGAVVHPGSHGIQLVPAYTYGTDEIAEMHDCIVRGLKRWSTEGADS